jgi:hypothetical protein
MCSDRLQIQGIAGILSCDNSNIVQLFVDDEPAGHTAPESKQTADKPSASPHDGLELFGSLLSPREQQLFTEKPALGVHAGLQTADKVSWHLFFEAHLTRALLCTVNVFHHVTCQLCIGLCAIHDVDCCCSESSRGYRHQRARCHPSAGASRALTSLHTGDIHGFRLTAVYKQDKVGSCRVTNVYSNVISSCHSAMHACGRCTSALVLTSRFTADSPCTWADRGFCCRAS